MNAIEFTKTQLETEYAKDICLKEDDYGSLYVYSHKLLSKKLVVRRQTAGGEAFRALKKLSNKNVVQIYDAFEENGNTLVLEEYIEGETLSRMLKTRLFTEAQTRRLISSLCDALYAVHKLNVIHRDVKPENIMIENGGELKLIDFSAARLYRSELETDTRIIGTIGFAAPEQFGMAQTDRRTDIYAIGVLTNILLTGEHPSTRSYSGRLRRVIEKCVQTSPEKRYDNVLELKKSL